MTDNETVREHISNSAISCYLKCGQQYKWKYIEGIYLPIGLSGKRGIVNHDVLEMNYTRVMERKTPMTDAELLARFELDWDEAIKQFIVPDPEGNDAITYDLPRGSQKDNETPEDAVARFKDQALGQLKAYIGEWEPHELDAPHSMSEVKPIAVEKQIRIELGDGLPDLLCFLDRIDEGGIIVDIKFPAKSPTKDDIVNDLQLTIYDLAYRVEYGEAPKGLRKEYAVGLKTPKVVIQTAPARDDEAIERLMNRIRQVVMGIREGIYMPADSACWWCGEKMCDFWSICDYRP